jgi:starch phosphorylase
VPPEESPLGYVTNGVHLPTFAAPAWRELLDQRLPGWRKRVVSPAEAAFLDGFDDAALRNLRSGLRIGLARSLRDRLAAQHRRNGLAEDRLAPILAGLELAERGAPVMGFARRFAPYKRATLLLQDAPRLARLLGDPARPALLVYAGKAHPRDAGGQALIRELYEASLLPEFAGRLFVVENYDLDLARRLVQGCDIWLNTPEYPLEASGTSGMKSAANGGVNVSVLDGWWAEGCDGDNGFGIEPVLGVSHEERNLREAQALFETLERRVLPEYYGDAGEPPSAAWLGRARRSAETALSRFSSMRMLDEYRNGFYSPAAGLAERMRGRRGKVAVNLARWRKLVESRWAGVRLEPARQGSAGAIVWTHGIPAESVAVEAEMSDGSWRRLERRSGDHERAEFALEGLQAAEVRAYRAWPEHELLAHRFELGLLLRAEVSAEPAG